MPRGVGQQVVQHLNDPLPVGHHSRQIVGQIDDHRVPAATGNERGSRRVRQRDHPGAFRVHRQRARLDATGVEQVADQPLHVIGLPVDDPEELQHLLRGSAGEAPSTAAAEPLMAANGARSSWLTMPRNSARSRSSASSGSRSCQGHHQRDDVSALVADRCRVDERAHASPVGHRQLHLLGAHRRGVADRAGQSQLCHYHFAAVAEAAGQGLERLLRRRLRRQQPSTMRRASGLIDAGRPVPASSTTTPTGEVSTSASRSARARCSSR